MQDLKRVCGLAVGLAGDGYTLEFGAEVTGVPPEVRRLEDMRPVLYNQTISQPQELYYMYRGVARAHERTELAQHQLRFDLTVLPPRRLGQEFMKTAGHYHPPVPGSELTYPELYQVLHGRAHFLLQARDPVGDALRDVVIVDGSPGDYLVVPPGYGHITINPGEQSLVMANWVAAGFSSVYDPMLQHRGGAFYAVEEDGQLVFVENEHYDQSPVPRLLPPGLPPIPGLEGEAIYQLPRQALRFLVEPAAYRQVWEEIGKPPES